MRLFFSFFQLLLLIVCLNLPHFYFAQNKRDAAGKRTGKWVFTGADVPNSGADSKAIVEEGYYLNGRKEGEWIKYYNDGKTTKLKGVYVNNRPQGDYRRFYQSEILKEKGSFSRSKYKGDLERYHANGKLAYKGTYNNSGEETGLVQYYHENGNLALEYTIKNGQLSGNLVRYNPNGTVKEKLFFDENGKISKSEVFVEAQNTPTVVKKPTNILPPQVTNPKTKGIRFSPNGYNKIYNTNEEIWMDGEFKNGQLWDGKVFDYDKDGILIKVRIFKQGKYHSDGQL